MKYVEKEAIYTNEICKECIFANGFEPCTKFADEISVEWCLETIESGKFPYITSLKK